MSSPLVVLILSLLLGVQPVTTDLYLPALPAITDGFGASMAQAQLTLSGLLLAFGLSQLVWGPISDRFGRRPVLLVGLVAYTIAAIGSAFAPSMSLLIVWRIVQGAAMGASVMCARAIVRDLYTPEAGARAMSKGLSGLGVIACLSTPLGGLLSDLFGWHAALLALALFAAMTLAVVVLRFEETVRTPNLRALEPVTLLRTWIHILRNPTFWAFALLAMMSYGGLFTFLAASSFVFIKIMGLSKTVYGALMFSMSAAYLGGTVMCRRLLKRYGVHRTVAIGGVFSLVGGTALGVLALLGVESVWAIMVPVYLFMLGHGVHQPCGQSGAVGPFPQAAGAASALSGFLMMLSAFGMGHWLGTHMDGTVLPLTNGMWFWGVMTAAVAWGLVLRIRPDSPRVAD
ncbi:MAG: multidrug effflux MFS transporter [Azoarcus sp.]|nr:multidrug effflux MFS transporter [Azoarcus sp.]